MRAWLLGILLALYWLIDRSAIQAWRSPEALWRHAAAVSPQSVRATGNHLRHVFAEQAP